MTDNVQHIRLVNGEEILGDVVSNEPETGICVDQPMLIDNSASDLGMTMALVDYNPFSKTRVTQFKPEHIVTVSDIHPTIKKYYYLSCRVSGVAIKRMLADITNVSNVMESVLMEESIDRSRLSKGTDTIQ